MRRLLALALASCGGHAAVPPDAFTPAPHPALDRGNIADQGGPILAHPRLVTVTFAGDAYEADVRAFGAWLPISSWLTTVGAEYGIGPGTSLGHVVLPDAAPASIDIAQLGALLAARVRDGTLPSDPSQGVEADTVYAVVLPPSTTTHVVQGDAGCAAAAGFHASYSDGSLLFVFTATPEACAAIVASRGFDVRSFVEVDASHEIFEALSDPYLVATDGSALASGPAAWEMADHANPWFGLGGELGDACTLRGVVADGFTVQRIWSNAAASAGEDPCQPAVPPFYGTSTAGDGAVAVAAGHSVQVALAGWSTTPASPWSVTAEAAPFITSTFVPSASVSPAAFDNGSTGTLTISAPAGTPAGSEGYVFVASRPAQGPSVTASWSVWPILVTVPASSAGTR